MAVENKNLNKGFTLAEAMLAVVILGAAAAGVLLPFSAGASIRAEGLHSTTGAFLASDLMEKIVKSPFEQILSGFNNYSEPEGQIKNAQGQLFTDAGYQKFSRTSTCAYVYVPQETTPVEPKKFILATVTVYYSGKQVAIINRLITR